jgi:cell division protein FtsL
MDKELEEKLLQRLALEKEWRSLEEPEPKTESMLLNEAEPKAEVRLSNDPEPKIEQARVEKPKSKQQQLDDIKKFKKALSEGDHHNIIDLLTKRSKMARLKFRQDVEQSYNDRSDVTKSGRINLIELVKKKLKGDFKHLIVAILTPLPTFYAKELHRAFKGLGTNEDAVLEILCTVNNDQLRFIKKHYVKKYNRELIDDIKGDTSGNFGRLLESLSSSERDECPYLDIENLKAEDRKAMVEQAKIDAQALYDGGVKRWGTDESIFCQIMCQRSHIQLRLIFEEYIEVSRRSKKEDPNNNEYEDLVVHENRKSQTKNQRVKDVIRTVCRLKSVSEEYNSGYEKYTIEAAIEEEFSGDMKNALLAIVESVQKKPKFFAKQLYRIIKDMKSTIKTRFRTSIRDVIRIVVTRCEIDLDDIKKEYDTKYGSLADAIKDNTTGSLQEGLLALIKE